MNYIIFAVQFCKNHLKICYLWKLEFWCFMVHLKNLFLNVLSMLVLMICFILIFVFLHFLIFLVLRFQLLNLKLGSSMEFGSLFILKSTRAFFFKHLSNYSDILDNVI